MQNLPTITVAAEHIRKGELTPTELLEQCLARIDQYEDRVRAWVYIDRDGAREQAAKLTAELRAGRNRGSLHGIPVGIKDIIDVFDMPTACGSKRWANSFARRDATCVARLRAAGAIIVGKTVTTAYASFDPPPTRNPWNLERTPGGSSSGSAAAVACGMCLAALATQTGGSITRPASYCGVYSLKPSHGRVSVDGVLPLAPSMDHVGVMANSVRDLAIVFQAIADRSPAHDVVTLIDEQLETAHRPVVWSMEEWTKETAEPKMRDAYCAKMATLSSLVFASPPGWSDAARFNHLVMAVQAAEYHGERLKRHPDDYPPRITELLQTGLRASATEYETALQARERTAELVQSRFEVDEVLASPAATSPAPLAATTGNPAFNSPWSYLGLPTISLPFGWAEDLPLSLQLTGKRNREHFLFVAAAQLERAIAFARRELTL